MNRFALIMAASVLALLTSCRKNAESKAERIPHVEVGPVTDAGVVLDQNASPKQVAYALLLAIRDDMRAKNDLAARDAALERQLRLCAVDTIFHRYRAFYDPFPVERDSIVYEAVRSWAPTLGHYVDSFPDDWPSAEAALRESRSKPAPGEQAESAAVLFEAADPNGDSNASAVIQISLLRENGFWRVLHVGFRTTDRHLAARHARTTQPAATLPTRPSHVYND